MSRPYEYRGWEDVYREQWTWDDVVHVSHLRTNCISTCSLDAYVKDGIVWREEQNANFPQEFEHVPDFNPRGCAAGLRLQRADVRPHPHPLPDEAGG